MDKPNLQVAPLADGPTTVAAALKAMRAKVAKECADEINEVLERHGCAIQPTPQLVPDGAGGWKIAVTVNIIPIG